MKRRISNIIMVCLICVILAVGIGVAITLRGGSTVDRLGFGFSASSLEDETGEHLCSITIDCKTAVQNAEKLAPGKAAFLPENGIILDGLQVAFTPGDTAFDVLRRICEKGGIQLEYSWTPLYDSYYIEGINHLYEFDCGPESGWMYRINGEFPNYGCSSYEVKDGDRILWCYTCEGLGTDVGTKVE